jgi:hypothetical protein
MLCSHSVRDGPLSRYAERGSAVTDALPAGTDLPAESKRARRQERDPHNLAKHRLVPMPADGRAGPVLGHEHVLERCRFHSGESRSHPAKWKQERRHVVQNRPTSGAPQFRHALGRASPVSSGWSDDCVVAPVVTRLLIDDAPDIRSGARSGKKYLCTAALVGLYAWMLEQSGKCRFPAPPDVVCG